MTVYLASDHAGFDFKEKIKAYLEEQQYQVVDCGADHFDKDDDYPDFIVKAAREVAQHPDTFGIVLGKSGAGEAIVANKVKGIRAVLCFAKENVLLARTHNNANILSLGEDFIDFETAKDLIITFLTTKFPGEERHKRRIDKITAIEEGKL